MNVNLHINALWSSTRRCSVIWSRGPHQLSTRWRSSFVTCLKSQAWGTAFIDEEAHEDLGVEQKLQRKLPFVSEAWLRRPVRKEHVWGKCCEKDGGCSCSGASIDWRLYRMSPQHARLFLQTSDFSSLVQQPCFQQFSNIFHRCFTSAWLTNFYIELKLTIS